MYTIYILNLQQLQDSLMQKSNAEVCTTVQYSKN